MIGAGRFIARRRYYLYRGELRDILRAAAGIKAAETGTVGKFEAALGACHGSGRAVCVNSGRIALLILLRAVGLRPGDEILVPAYTLRALVVLLAAQGYVPVPVDVVPGGFNMDPEEARGRTGPKTRAVLATHLFGRPCAVEAFASLASSRGMLLIEDCAQAFGSTVSGRHAGTFGDGAILSFDLLKPVNTFGGGALLTRSAEAYAAVMEEARKLDDNPAAAYKRIATGLFEHLILTTPLASVAAAALSSPLTRAAVAKGYRSVQDAARPAQSRFTELQAAIGLRQLQSLDARTALRRDMAGRLSSLLGEDPAAAMHPGENGYFFVRKARGDAAALRRELLSAGIDAGIGAEVADFCGDVGRGADCPNAADAFARAIQLPLHEGLRDRDLERIAAACRGRVEPIPRAAD